MLNITNYSDHPTRIGFTVFKFREKQRANHFEALLEEDNIWFEASVEADNLYLFGVKKGDFKKAMNANYLVSAKFRNKIIPNVYVGWVIIIITIAIISLAVVSAFFKT